MTQPLSDNIDLVNVSMPPHMSFMLEGQHKGKNAHNDRGQDVGVRMITA